MIFVETSIYVHIKLFETQSKDAAIIFNFFSGRSLTTPQAVGLLNPFLIISRKASNKKCHVKKEFKKIDTVHLYC
jgi:hypothetical protein